MVSTRIIIIIGAGLAVVAGLAYFTYQYTMSDTLGGQLARSRLGLDKLPPPRSLVNPNADLSKPLSQQPKDPFMEFIEKAYENVTNWTPPPGGYGNFLLPKIQIPTSHTANAAMLYRDLSAEEEKYEPWALR